MLLSRLGRCLLAVVVTEAKKGRSESETLFMIRRLVAM